MALSPPSSAGLNGVIVTDTPAASEVLTATDATHAAWAPASGGGLFSGYALLRDEKANNTNGGAFNSGAWRTRDLTVESSDVGGIVSLAANQFTLQAGTYWLYARAPAYAVDHHKAKLANITDTADTLVGSSMYCEDSTNVVTDSIVQGRFTIAGAKVFEIQHRCQVSGASGFGVGVGFGVIEVYTEVQIWKEA